jgi:hypothetical protein
LRGEELQLSRGGGEKITRSLSFKVEEEEDGGEAPAEEQSDEDWRRRPAGHARRRVPVLLF